MNLYQKLALTLLTTFVLLVGAFALILQSLEAASRDKAEQELHRNLAAYLVQDNPLLASGKYDKKALENLFHSMMILGPNFEFYVLDPEGKILTYSAKPGEVIRDSVSLEPINWSINQQMSFPLYADDPRSNKQKIFSVAEVKTGEELTGYLYVIIGGQKYDSIFSSAKNNEKLRVMGYLAAASLVFLFICLLISFKLFVRPLKQLASQVTTLKARLNQETLTPLESQSKSGEVAELTLAFNQLISQVNRQIVQLESVDKDRRELLAHLSHDLRTPLSSLQGFLETIKLKAGELTQRENLNYVDKSLKNANSLKSFVDQIFELAHLESGEITVTKESFPIADLLYDTVDKFSGLASKKSISLKVLLDNEQLMLNTDIAKLERILTNLIENAIRHTPENGEIILQASTDNKVNQVTLEINDNGTGLNQQELPSLFDARFRGKQAVDDENRHIGLGLTITRKLVRVLGSEISARNNSQGGASFSFALPLRA
ncbi:HAMP domain-containing histidine kinase [Aliikangiella marina]|uniref:histidine kinase n=1 Tax=Aliikangiella marina TaxID=1712262 RepID=A0A545THU6_9GAMM|nr:HAMP domain-containing sensor histidine kinase [Aliikangiella marina]TQV76778.1 HAMP domain-containing histidine kinase [Aliikangiella marina]